MRMNGYNVKKLYATFYPWSDHQIEVIKKKLKSLKKIGATTERI
jgi:beta-N-acetylglucosaminidase